ncbi:MAG: Ppx/GppA family phosphatase [Neisseriaceae bacterium]|nr:Ppx/GppA family phosphatase [Neisseriaceae bacterium]
MTVSVAHANIGARFESRERLLVKQAFDFDVLATVDLGSNSFRLQISRKEGTQLFVIDSLKEMVRFGAGLGKDKYLTEESQERALSCLAKFGERLRGFATPQVRVVATNTFRVAKNIGPFLERAEAVLGFPIEIIAGREEARLIYLGVAHTSAVTDDTRLVVDIGGGSTEFVIGNGLVPQVTESLALGCVSHSLRFFPDGEVTEAGVAKAVWAARTEVQRISMMLKDIGWDVSIGTSGTARSLSAIFEALGDPRGMITLPAMKLLMNQIVRAGSVESAAIMGLKADRLEVFAGGLAVMMAIFEELAIEEMAVTDAALRDGVLYDLIGRQLDADMRDETVARFQNRYRADVHQGEMVSDIAQQYFEGMAKDLPMHEMGMWLSLIDWAAKLHEIGLSIAHTAYHKHSAYIVKNADMPGFSRREQNKLAVLILGHRGDMKKMLEQIGSDEYCWAAVLSLRLAALFCRGRKDVCIPHNTKVKFQLDKKKCTLQISNAWLALNPLTVSALTLEEGHWEKIGRDFAIKPLGSMPETDSELYVD